MEDHTLGSDAAGLPSSNGSRSKIGGDGDGDDSGSGAGGGGGGDDDDDDDDDDVADGTLEDSDDDDDDETFGWNMDGEVFEELPGFLDSRPPQPEEDISAPAGFGRAEPLRSSQKSPRVLSDADRAERDEQRESESSPDFTEYVAPDPHDFSRESSAAPSQRSSRFVAPPADYSTDDNEDDEYDDAAEADFVSPQALSETPEASASADGQEEDDFIASLIVPPPNPGAYCFCVGRGGVSAGDVVKTRVFIARC